MFYLRGKKMDLNNLIELNKKYLGETIHPGYRDIAEHILIELKKVEKGESFSGEFYDALVDGFDIYSDFYGELCRYLEEHPELISR